MLLDACNTVQLVLRYLHTIPECPKLTDRLGVVQIEGESKPAPDLRAVGRPRLSSTGHVYAGLSDEEVEVSPEATDNAPCNGSPLSTSLPCTFCTLKHQRKAMHRADNPDEWPGSIPDCI